MSLLLRWGFELYLLAYVAITIGLVVADESGWAIVWALVGITLAAPLGYILADRRGDL